MKKILFASLAALAILISSPAFGQGEAPIGKGGKMVNFGITGTGHGIPMYASMEWGVHPDITVGGRLSTNVFSGDNWFKVGAMGNYHWNKLIGIPSNWDFYAGLNLGYRIEFGGNNNQNHFDFGGQVGGRWFWSDRWGLNAELGFSGAAAGGLGLTVRF